MRPIAARSRSSREQQLERLDELVAVRVVEPALLWTQCSTRTSLRALASIGVPTANASSASSDRLSYGDGHDDDGRGFERLQPFALREQAGEPDERLLGQLHQLDAHQHERRVAARPSRSC